MMAVVALAVLEAERRQCPQRLRRTRDRMEVVAVAELEAERRRRRTVDWMEVEVLAVVAVETCTMVAKLLRSSTASHCPTAAVDER
jgi:hypothetical protein